MCQKKAIVSRTVALEQIVDTILKVTATCGKTPCSFKASFQNGVRPEPVLANDRFSFLKLIKRKTAQTERAAHLTDKARVGVILDDVVLEKIPNTAPVYTCSMSKLDFHLYGMS